MRATIIKPAVNGQALYVACGYDRRLAASIIVTRPDEEQEQLLNSILASGQRRSVAASVAAIRSSLGMEADHALEISSGRYE
jgi:hypothetical protein